MRLTTRYLHGLRTEGAGRGRQAAAVGLGVFLGCTPFYGAHFWICLAAAWLLRLNRLKVYLAANISNPFVAPFLIFSEIQTGSLLRRGAFYPLTIDAVRAIDPWRFALDLLIGSAVVGAVLGVVAAAVSWRMELPRPPADETLIADAAEKCNLECGIAAWEFANGKLRFDPVYLDACRAVRWPDEGRILDLGCGRGLMLALLAARYQREASAALPLVTLHGIEYRPRMVTLARQALGEAVTIDEGDLTTAALPGCRVALLFDVLHCLPGPMQEALLTRLRDCMEPGGVLVVREANAAGGWRFTLGETCNRLVALLQGRWRRRFQFRTADEWSALLGRFGFEVEGDPRGHNALYANVLLIARKKAESCSLSLVPLPPSTDRTDTRGAGVCEPAPRAPRRSAASPVARPCPGGPCAARESVRPPWPGIVHPAGGERTRAASERRS